MSTNNNNTRKEFKSNLQSRRFSSLTFRFYVFICLSSLTFMSTQFIRWFNCLRRRMFSFFSFFQIALSKDFESNNMFDNNVSANNNFRNISKYETFNNKELFFLQLSNSFSQSIIRSQRKRFRRFRNLTHAKKTLFEIYIIICTSNISIELYMFSTLRQKHNQYSYCDTYQYKKKWRRSNNKIYWQYCFNDKVLVDIINFKDNFKNIEILFKFNQNKLNKKIKIKRRKSKIDAKLHRKIYAIKNIFR